MKLTLITVLLGFGMSAASLAAEPFRVYAPASKTQTLWIVDAVPKEDGGLELKVAEKRDLGLTAESLPRIRKSRCSISRAQAENRARCRGQW